MPSSDTGRRQPFFRLSTLVLLFGLITVLLTWKPRTVSKTETRVLSGSMAPFILGPHLRFTCEDCSFPYETDPVLISSQKFSRCPNCGKLNETDNLVHQGDLIRLFGSDDIEPSRWDVVAFRRSPEHIQDGESDVAIKRVVGLPGEDPSFENGELYINGKLYQKNLSEFLTLATLVHDSQFIPKSFNPADQQNFIEAPPGEFNKAASSWTFSENRWSCLSNEAEIANWLNYHQQFVNNGLVFPAEISIGSYVLDFNGFNQHADRFPMYHVYDLVVHFILRTDDLSKLGIRVSDVVAELQLEEGIGQIYQYTGDQAIGKPFDVGNDAELHIRLGRVDGRAWVQIGDNTPLSVVLPTLDVLHERDHHWINVVPFSVAAADGEVSLERFLLYRDVYWLDSNNENKQWSLSNPLSSDEWFVVGDNLVQSIDSRHWNRPVTRKQLLSLVKRVNLY